MALANLKKVVKVEITFIYSLKSCSQTPWWVLMAVSMVTVLYRAHAAGITEDGNDASQGSESAPLPNAHLT